MGSHMDSTASAEEGSLFHVLHGSSLFNATCTTGGWVPSLPQPPYECNDTVTSRFPTTEANNRTKLMVALFAVL